MDENMNLTETLEEQLDYIINVKKTNVRCHVRKNMPRQTKKAHSVGTWA